jgi:O-antigen/teichoic acid export membrane protein
MSLKKTTFWLVLVNGINFGINFIFAPFLSRALSIEDYGSYGQALMTSQLLVLIFSIGIPSVYTMLLSQYRKNANILFSHVSYIFFILTLISIVIQFILAVTSKNWLGNDISKELSIFIFHTIGGILSSILTLHLIFRQISKPLVWITLFLNTVKIIFALLMIQYYHNYYGFIWVISIMPLLNLFLLYIQIPKLDRKWTSLKYYIIKKIVLESYPYFILGILGYATLYVDGWLISKMLSVNDYAIYRNGAIEIPFIATIYSSIASVLLGRLSILYRERKFDEIFEFKKKASTIIAAITYPIILILAINANYLIPLYFSNKYINSSIVFSLYSIAVMVRINDYTDLLILNKNRKIIIFAFFASFLFNLVTSIFLIKLLSSAGAALSYSLSIIFLASILTLFTCIKYNRKIHEYFDFNNIFKIFVLSLFLSFIVKQFTFNIIIFGIVSVLSVILAYFLGLKYFKWIEYSILPKQIQSWFK